MFNSLSDMRSRLIDRSFKHIDNLMENFPVQLEEDIENSHVFVVARNSLSSKSDYKFFKVNSKNSFVEFPDLRTGKRGLDKQEELEGLINLIWIIAGFVIPYLIIFFFFPNFKGVGIGIAFVTLLLNLFIFVAPFADKQYENQFQIEYQNQIAFVKKRGNNKEYKIFRDSGRMEYYPPIWDIEFQQSKYSDMRAVLSHNKEDFSDKIIIKDPNTEYSNNQIYFYLTDEAEVMSIKLDTRDYFTLFSPIVLYDKPKSSGLTAKLSEKIGGNMGHRIQQPYHFVKIPSLQDLEVKMALIRTLISYYWSYTPSG